MRPLPFPSTQVFSNGCVVCECMFILSVSEFSILNDCDVNVDLFKEVCHSTSLGFVSLSLLN